MRPVALTTGASIGIGNKITLFLLRIVPHGALLPLLDWGMRFAVRDAEQPRAPAS